MSSYDHYTMLRLGLGRWSNHDSRPDQRSRRLIGRALVPKWPMHRVVAVWLRDRRSSKRPVRD